MKNMEPLIVNVNINAPIEKVWAFFNGSRTYCELEFCTRKLALSESRKQLRNWWRIFLQLWPLKISRQVLFFMERTEIIPLQEKIEYHIEDGRKPEVFFS